MIAVRLQGRLGNQLFQYAFIYAAAKRLNTKFYLDKSVDYLILDKYFNIQNDFCHILDNKVFSIKGYKNILSHYFRWGFYYSLRNIIRLKRKAFSNFESPAQQLNNVKNSFLYEGYFQSEEYFINYKEDIRKLFGIKNTYQTLFAAMFSTLPKAKKYITVHVRRGDYIDNNLVLPVSYYHKAINSIEHPDNYYIFVSDDSNFVKKEFAYISNKYVSENDEITDLQFLTHADICILSNSSFSWWGAWLNRKNATIIAPQYWLGNDIKQEIPINTLVADWIKI
ncbi:MAG TPA: alpha-1,2-fucosyltransferase [Mucilaginibacter sp.]|jgi:hypothetical protein|nr:alpha-1,2-fucosyltransferase [Mucilaginibacter sp.]